MSIWRWRNYE